MDEKKAKEIKADGASVRAKILQLQTLITVISGHKKRLVDEELSALTTLTFRSTLSVTLTEMQGA